MKNITPASERAASKSLLTPARVSGLTSYSRQPYFSRKKDLPVLGRAQGGSDGSIIMEENPIDWTYRPADLQGVQGAFAVYVTGNSMFPKYKDQDIAYIHPSAPLRKDRYVLLETKDHKGLIKQFTKWAGDTLILQQFNPEKELTFKRSQICNIMLVIGSLDS